MTDPLERAVIQPRFQYNPPIPKMTTKRNRQLDACPECHNKKDSRAAICFDCTIKFARPPVIPDAFSVNGESCKYLPLSGCGGLYAIVDADLYEWLMQWRWIGMKRKQDGKCYAITYMSTPNPKGFGRKIWKRVRLANVVKGMSPNIRLDHANRTPLDNRGSNLRPCTVVQNGANRSKNKNNTSGYMGVSRAVSKNWTAWKASLRYLGINITIGHFSTAMEAAYARDALALKLHGEFASLNFPLPESHF